MKKPLRRFLSLFTFFGVGLTFAVAAVARFWAAPFSSGVDVPQFWAFAKVFQEYGFTFYRYADASLPIFPVQGWGFVYPPVWLLSLRWSLWAVPGSIATNQAVDVSWRVAEKAPIIIADLAIGALIYWGVKGAKWKKLLFAAVWLLNPAAWYQSAVFGQFDSIAAGFLLASVLAFERRRDIPGAVLAGLAVMTKQYMLLPVVVLLAINLRERGLRKSASNFLWVGGVVVLLSLPFLIGGGGGYLKSVFIPGQTYDYGNPLVFVFSGSKAALTYLNQAYGLDTVGWLKLNMPFMALALLAACVVCYKRQVGYAAGALIGLLIFVGISYQVNYQYLVSFMPLAALVAARAGSKSADRWLALALALLPAVWLWLFDVSLWFGSYLPYSLWVRPYLQRIGMVRFMPDWVFVIFAVALTGLSLAFAVRLLARREGAPKTAPAPEGSLSPGGAPMPEDASVSGNNASVSGNTMVES